MKYLTKGAYAKFLKLSQYEKLVAISKARESGIRPEDIYMMELAYETGKEKFIDAAINLIKA